MKISNPWKLVDSKGTVHYTGIKRDCDKLHNLLLADPSDVSEADEIMWEKELRSISWSGTLSVERNV